MPSPCLPVSLDLPGPSRRIRVEPLRPPLPRRQPAGPAPREPARAPAREPAPAPEAAPEPAPAGEPAPA